MGHGAEERLELLGIEAGILREREGILDALRDGGRGKTFQGQRGQIFLRMSLNRRETSIECLQQPQAIDGQAGMGNVIVEFRDEREGHLIDGEAENHAGMRVAIDNQFALGIVEAASEGKGRGPEDHALMTPMAALDPSVMQGETHGLVVMRPVTGLHFILEGLAKRADKFMEGWANG